jgi:hypothetical protein
MAEESLLSRIVPSEKKEEVMREMPAEFRKASEKESRENRDMLRDMSREIEILRKTKEENDKKFFDMSKDIGVLKTSLVIKEAEINQLISEAKNSFNEIFAPTAGKIDTVTRDIADAQKKVTEIKSFLSTNSNGVSDFFGEVDYVDRLEKRIDFLESKMARFATGGSI